MINIALPSTYSPPTGVPSRQHSHQIDIALGLNVSQIEKQLQSIYKCHNEISSGKPLYTNNHAWIGLEPEILQTPYSEIRDFFEKVKDFNISSVIDIGSGYGRLGFVMQAYFPKATFLGVEVVKERSDEANRVFQKHSLDNCQSRAYNILENISELPQADLYFIYDFSEPEDIRKLLDKLSDKLSNDKFFVVAKGNGIRSIIQNRYPEFWAAYGAVHHESWSLYSSYLDLETNL